MIKMIAGGQMVRSIRYSLHYDSHLFGVQSTISQILIHCQKNQILSQIQLSPSLLIILRMGECMSRGDSQIASWADKIKFGDVTLKNRVFMAPMTRIRGDPKDGIPNDLMAQYYSQRAGAGLIFTQCASWSQRGVAYPGAGEIYNTQQADGWKKVVDQVHKKGGVLVLQLIHAGRATAAQINGGLEAWAPSAIAVREDTSHFLHGKNFPVPKEMTLQDIETTKKQFESSIKLAKEAGFDGVELSAGHGYLIDQFIRSNSNKRKDKYGGNVENRARFVLQLVDIALKYFKASQFGLRLTPVGRLNDNSDENPLETYTYLVKQLNSKAIGFIEFYESVEKEWGVKSLHLHPPAKSQIENVCHTFRPYFNGLIIANNGFNAQTGLQKLKSKDCDAISFGKLYITNPDLAEKIINGAPIDSNLDFKTLYGSMLTDKSKGYTEYQPYKKQ